MSSSRVANEKHGLRGPCWRPYTPTLVKGEWNFTATALRRPSGAAIVYCFRRRDTESLAAELRRKGLAARAYHAGLPAEERIQIETEFRDDRLRIVVATVAFGMGIDRSDVRCVVHAFQPESIEHYMQETGRAGRDGLPAECLLLYGEGDFALRRSVLERSALEQGLDEEIFAAKTRLMTRMRDFCTAQICRHRGLVRYLGQQYEIENCGACDFCLEPQRPAESGNFLARSILGVVREIGGSFGTSHIVDVLRGSRSERVRSRGHDRLKEYGLLARLDKETIQDAIRQLIGQRFLRRTEDTYPVLLLSPEGREALEDDREIVLLEPRRQPMPETKGNRSSDKGAASGGAGELSSEDAALFEALRDVRREIAARLSVPAYIVFEDTALREMARLRPQNDVELLEVRGVGKVKLERFGATFLEAIHDFGRT